MDKKVLVGIGIGGVVALALGGKAIASHLAKKEVDKAIAEVSEFVEVDYKKVDQSILGRGTKVKDVSITPVGTGDTIEVDEIVLYDFDQKDDVPTYMNFAINGIELDLAKMEENGANLTELGYEGMLSGDFSTEYEYEEESQTVRLKKIEMGAEDFGTLEFNMELANVNLDEDAIATFPLSLFGAEFINAKVTYEDDSFVERILKSGAESQDITLEEAKEALIEDLESQAESEALPANFVAEMKEFINNPDSFSMTFSPEQPVPFSSFLELNTPEEIVDRLNISFES